MRQRVTPGVKITLSLEKLDTQNIGYHHPSVPLSAKKALPAYMEQNSRKAQQEQQAMKQKFMQLLIQTEKKTY